MFFIVEEIDNDRSGVYTKVSKFYNDGSYSAVTSDEVNKLFDNVPLKADSQAISGNRLMYSGYTEGYDNLEVDGSVQPNYIRRAETFDTSITLNAVNGSSNKSITIDLSDLPGTIEAGNTYTFDMSILLERVNLFMKDYPLSWRVE